MIVATFTVMYLAAKESLGAGYAKRNLGLALTFTLVGGIGFVIWPVLVNTEINKFRNASNQSANTQPNEA